MDQAIYQADSYGERGEAALAALLVFLGEHTEEWGKAARLTKYATAPDAAMRDLLAVLGSGEE
jgi:hypothetical protein